MLIDPHLHDARVLVCDDSAAHARMLAKLLSDGGVGRVDIVTDPRRVLPTLSGQRDFMLLLLDLDMPELDGFEVMELLRSELREDEQIPVIVITGLAPESVKLQALQAGAADFVHKPFDHTEVLLRVRNMLRLQDLVVRGRELARSLEMQVQERTEELERTAEVFVRKLAMVCEMREQQTTTQVWRIGRLASLLAEQAGLAPTTCQMIESAAPLHDVGNVMVPLEILLKPGKLTDEEFASVQRHAEAGSGLLGERDSALVRMASTIAVSHHERWDGSGYPHGLRGESIPIEGRITAICDVFDALTSRRPYKDPWSVQNAVDYLVGQAGQQFDPRLVDLFVRNLEDVEKICAQTA